MLLIKISQSTFKNDCSRQGIEPDELSSIPLFSEAESVSEAWKGDVEDWVLGIFDPREDSHILA